MKKGLYGVGIAWKRDYVDKRLYGEETIQRKVYKERGLYLQKIKRRLHGEGIIGRLRGEKIIRREDYIQTTRRRDYTDTTRREITQRLYGKRTKRRED